MRWMKMLTILSREQSINFNHNNKNKIPHCFWHLLFKNSKFLAGTPAEVCLKNTSCYSPFKCVSRFWKEPKSWAWMNTASFFGVVLWVENNITASFWQLFLFDSLLSLSDVLVVLRVSPQSLGAVPSLLYK